MKKLILIGSVSVALVAGSGTYDFSNTWFYVRKADARLAGWPCPNDNKDGFVTNATLRVNVPDGYTPRQSRGIQSPIIVGKGATVYTNGTLRLYDVRTNEFIGTWISRSSSWMDSVGKWTELKYAYRAAGLPHPRMYDQATYFDPRSKRKGLVIVIR